MRQKPKRKSEKYKPSEESIGVNICDLEFGNGFLDMIPKLWVVEEK